MHSEAYQAKLRQNINKMSFEDPYSSTGFSVWSDVTRQRKSSTLNIQMHVPVHMIAITMSHAPCDPLKDPYATCNAVGIDTNLSQFYPIISYTGNLPQTIDPTVPSELATIGIGGIPGVPSRGSKYDFCYWKGCDYTIRVTYKDGSVKHVVLQGGFRIRSKPGMIWNGRPAIDPASLNPLDPKSFKTWVINVPGGTQATPKLLSKIELLDTPQVFDGFPAAPTVLFSRFVP